LRGNDKVQPDLETGHNRTENPEWILVVHPEANRSTYPSFPRKRESRILPVIKS